MFMTATKPQSKPLANLDNITIMSNEVNGEHYIVAEWSMMPVESFDTITAAIDFVRGFKGLPVAIPSQAYNNGQIMKSCLLTDVNQFGMKVYKVRELENNGCIV